MNEVWVNMDWRRERDNVYVTEIHHLKNYTILVFDWQFNSENLY